MYLLYDYVFRNQLHVAGKRIYTVVLSILGCGGKGDIHKFVVWFGTLESIECGRHWEELAPKTISTHVLISTSV